MATKTPVKAKATNKVLETTKKAPVLVEEQPRLAPVPDEVVPVIEEPEVVPAVKPIEEEVVPAKEQKKYDLVQLPGGKYELRLPTEKGYKVLLKSSLEKCKKKASQL